MVENAADLIARKYQELEKHNEEMKQTNADLESLIEQLSAKSNLKADIIEWVGIGAALLFFGFVGYLEVDLNSRRKALYLSPNIYKGVEQGYIKPSELEILKTDRDGDGLQEIAIQYRGKPYFLKVKENEQPFLDTLP